MGSGACAFFCGLPLFYLFLGGGGGEGACGVWPSVQMLAWETDLPTRVFLAHRGTHRSGKPVRHWETVNAGKKKAAPIEARAVLSLTVVTTLMALFFGPEREKLVRNSLRKSAADIAKEARSMFALSGNAPVQMQALLAIGVNVVTAKGQSIRMGSPDQKQVRGLAVDITSFLLMLRGQGVKCKNPAVYTAAVLTILTVGYSHRGCVLMPAIPWVARCVPGDMQYRIVGTIGCRAVSIAVRTLKAAVISASGNALPHRRFLYTGVGSN